MKTCRKKQTQKRLFTNTAHIFRHAVGYGNIGCGVFKRGVQNQKDFCLRINILKGNY